MPCPARRRVRGGRSPARRRSRVLRKRRPGIAGSRPVERRAERRSDDAAVRQPGAVRSRRAAPAGPRHAVGIGPDGGRLHLPPPRRRDVSRRAAHPRQGRARLDAPRPRPRVQVGAAVAALPHQGRPRVRGGKGQSDRGARGPGRQYHRVHFDGAAQHLPQVSRDAGRRGGAHAHSAGVRPGAGGQRAVEIRLVVPRRRDRADQEPDLLGRPAEGGQPDGAHHPGGAHPGCRVRDGQSLGGRNPLRRDPALGDGAPRTAAAPARAPGSLHRYEHDPGTAQGRARPASPEPGHRRRDPAPDPDGGPRRAGRGRHPAGHHGLRLDSRPVRVGHRRRPQAAGGGGLRARIQAAALAQQARRARTGGAVGTAGSRAARHPGGDPRARRAQRAGHRPEWRGRPLSGRLVRRLSRPGELLVSPLPLEQQGAGRELRVPVRQHARRDDRPCAQHARHGGEGPALARDRRPRVRPRAVDLPLVPGRRLGGAARREGMAHPGGVHRPAVDGGRARP